jgi:hypothetical protein
MLIFHAGTLIHVAFGPAAVVELWLYNVVPLVRRARGEVSELAQGARLEIA